MTGSHVTFPPYFFPVLFFRTFFPVPFFLTFFPRTFFSHNFFPVLLFPYFFLFPAFFSPVIFSRNFPPLYLLFPVLYSPYFFFIFLYYFSVLFQKSRRLKSNVLKYQLVVFLVHVVIAQFMFLANIHSSVTRRASPGWVGCAHARYEGTKMNLFNTKED